MLDRLAALDRVRIVPNKASFYVMFDVDGIDDSLAFCKRAVHEAGVGLAPGIAFGAASARQIRLCYARSDAQLTEAMDRLSLSSAARAERRGPAGRLMPRPAHCAVFAVPHTDNQGR